MAGQAAQSTGFINGVVIQTEGRLLAEEAGTVHFKRNAKPLIVIPKINEGPAYLLKEQV